jgi:MFS family permease
VSLVASNAASIAPPEIGARAMAFRPLYFAFAGGYLLSYLYRTVTAVISPELVRELAVTPSSLGLLTSGYFIAFGAVQVPAGMMLDRFGPRRVEPVLLLIAGTGALAFAYGRDVGSLLFARALIGLGVATCLMAPLKAITTWYPNERHASLSSWVMVAGGLGALAATAPTELALRFVSWRTLFVVLAAVTYAVAAWIWLVVPDIPRPPRTSGWRAQWAGVRSVFAHRRFWWIAPLASIGIGTFMAIQGLWSVPYLMEVGGFDRAGAADRLLVMGIVMLAGYASVGLFATRLGRRGILPRHLFATGFSTNAIALAAIVLDLPGSYFWWTAYGLGAVVNVLGFAVLNEGFPKELAGRASTGLNLLMFGGSFAAQWGIGVIVDAARAGLAVDTGAALRLAFATMLALDAATVVWFAIGWRTHAATRRSPA